MKKIITGILILGSLSTQASTLSNCYFEYANKRLESKMMLGISTLGVGTLIDQIVPESGIAAATELLTETIAQNEELAPLYLEEIKDGAFGSKLEKIIIKKQDHRLKKLVNEIKHDGYLMNSSEKDSKAIITQVVTDLVQSGELCVIKARTVNKIKNAVMDKL